MLLLNLPGLFSGGTSTYSTLPYSMWFWRFYVVFTYSAPYGLSGQKWAWEGCTGSLMENNAIDVAAPWDTLIYTLWAHWNDLFRVQVSDQEMSGGGSDSEPAAGGMQVLRGLDMKSLKLARRSYFGSIASGVGPKWCWGGGGGLWILPNSVILSF